MTLYSEECKQLKKEVLIYNVIWAGIFFVLLIISILSFYFGMDNSSRYGTNDARAIVATIIFILTLPAILLSIILFFVKGNARKKLLNVLLRRDMEKIKTK